MSNTEMLGSWWLANPSDAAADYQPPEKTLAGLLRTGESLSWELTTIGRTGPNDDFSVMFQWPDLPEHRAIWGTDVDGTCVSLLDPFPTNYVSRFNSPFNGNEEWGFDSYALGKAWVTPDDVIESLSVSFDGLDHWVVDPKSNGRDYFPTDDELMKFEVPERLEHEAQINNAQVHLAADSKGSASGLGFAFERIALFEIEGTMTLDQVFPEWIEPLSVFVSLMTGVPASLGEVQLKLPELLWPLNLHYKTTRSHVVHNQGLSLFDYIAPLPTVVSLGLNFGPLLQAFFALWGDDKDRAALTFLSESQSGVPNESNEARLLSAAKAAEQYHATRLDSQSLRSKEHRIVWMPSWRVPHRSIGTG